MISAKLLQLAVFLLPTLVFAQKADGKACPSGQTFSKKLKRCVPSATTAPLPSAQTRGQAATKPKEVEWVNLGNFSLTRTEITSLQYEQCVTAGACSEPGNDLSQCNWKQDGKEGHPINCVNLAQATKFCEWVGGRLPSSEEWLVAATNDGVDAYPWGNAEPSKELAHFGYREDGLPGTAEAGSHPKGANKKGVLDLAGSVWEWTSTTFEIREGVKQPQARGGRMPMRSDDISVSNHLEMSASNQTPNVGIRCAK